MNAPSTDAPVPAHEAVYRALRSQILDGELAPGASLTLRGVAERLGVSMTPAREAVRRLVAERALAMTDTGRVQVPLPDADALDELFRARSLLEPELAVRALPRIDKALISQLRAIDERLGSCLEAGDAAGYVRANNAFHGLLYSRAEAPALMALVESVWLQTSPVMRRVYGRTGTGALVDYHEAALDALAARDAEALAAAIRSDVEQGMMLAREAAPPGR
ncbi:GntR family transcriptional regulator [Limibaculum sp. M0105]|uniref:GntR family transcriptional regulator n=1 Tax=Thermohalobaculum xanthum TaxID=2753746 RepID=A0A8J7M6W3_9RHOB|nr:GntR family transcriptional regulator [Thermohalobaculum xanthum]MBK0398634.1 GntR family transcriptional regulator [Thermohalobaculum xanthum]